MTFLAPGFLFGALAVALGIVALHFIVTRQPRAAILPTARFVPDSPATAIVRDARPSDLLLMLLRVLIVLAAGAALARPVIKPSRQAQGQIFVVDASRAVANISEAIDTTKRLYREGDAIIVFDSSARNLGGIDSLGVVKRNANTGNLSGALIASLRAASAMRDRVDSIDLVIVSPLVDEEFDAATDSIRKLWKGRARIVRTAAHIDSSSAASTKIDLRSNSEDALAITTAIANKLPEQKAARFFRTAAFTPDENQPVVVWPVSERPPFAVAASPDLSGGVTTGAIQVVAPFSRRWKFPADSIRTARVIAWWADGEPAAIEKPIGQSCIKSVAIPVVAIGDLVIRPEFVRFVSSISSVCGGGISSTPRPVAALASLTGKGPLASSKNFSAREDIDSPLAPWLLGIALLAALSELYVRRR
ncbi:MAG TPA: BatA domain-containing protein [Gemmatimonadaceae bacterium]|nr:BatA domain-containing protein [Gemmatimonadaceae bacterium]